MLNNGPLSVFIRQKLLPGTLKKSDSCLFSHLWYIWWPSVLALKVSEMLKSAPVSLIHWQTLSPCTFEWSYGSKTLILSIVGHVANLDAWISNFQKCLTLTQCLFDWKKFLSCIFKWSCGSKTVFLSIFGHVVTMTFDLWTSSIQKCLTLAL